MSKKIRNEFGALLGQIETASKALNRAAERATGEIEAIEKQLLDIEPGVEVWAGTLVDESIEVTGEDGEKRSAKHTIKLGFAKAKKWGIALSDDVVDEQGKTLSSERTLLRKADRDLRLKGHSHLAGLLDAVLAELTDRVDQLPQEEPASETDAPLGTDGSDATLEVGVADETYAA